MSVAKKFGLTVDELRQLNKLRTFSKPFAKLGAGDELDVPHSLPQGIAPRASDNSNDSGLASHANTAGTMLHNGNTSGAAANMAHSVALGQGNALVEEWLNNYGTARAQINVDRDSNLSGSELDWLLPVYEDPNNLLFTQVGVRNKDGRTTTNLGVGARTLKDDWLYGVNSFFDNDITGKNHRVGVGAEAWADFLKFSANGYMGITNWHQSRDFEDYNERPANGFDVRTKAYLPFYPQIGSLLMYEKYFGKEVALFGKGDRRKNPQAVTGGVNYTPIPLITTGLEHRSDSGGNSDSSVGLQFTFRPGASLRSHFNPEAVAASRTLAGSRHDLVDRNNNIVLEYKKQELLRLALPAQVMGPAGNVGKLTGQVTAKHGVRQIDWDASAVIAAGGAVARTSLTALDVTFPPYQAGGDNSYLLSAVAQDQRGNVSNRETTRVYVTPPLTLAMSVVSDNASSNGIASNRVQALVTEPGQGKPVPDQMITFSADNGATILNSTVSTNSAGVAISDLTNNVSGVSVVTALYNGTTQSVPTRFGPHDAADITSLVATVDNAVANGLATNTVQATVLDGDGKPLTAQTVNFSMSRGTATVSTARQDSATVTAVTDERGQATATFSSTVAAGATVKAQLGNGRSRTTDVIFTADGSTATITAANMTVLQDNSVSNGLQNNRVKVIVTDAFNNAVPNQTVNFTADNGARVVTSTVITDNSGSAVAGVVSFTVGVSVVTASINGNSQSVDTTFGPRVASASVTDLTVLIDNAKADGLATNSVQASIKDVDGNVLPNMPVTFVVTAGTANVLTVSVDTDAAGQAVTLLNSTVTGAATVTAALNNGRDRAVDTRFTADGGTATITTANIRVTADNALANGTALNSVQVMVTDANGNVVPNQPVTFSADNGATISGSMNTNDLGIATATLTNTAAGVTEVTAATNGNSQSKNTSFVADDSTATITSANLTVSTDNAIADGTASNAVQVIVTDANGNVVPNQPVTFSVDNGSTISGSMDTNDQGIATATLTNTTAGVTAVTAATNGNSQSKNTTFIADSSTADILSGNLTVLTNDALANDMAANRVQVQVTDSHNNPVPNQSVTFSVESGVAIVVTDTVVTDGSGLADTALTSTVASGVTVKATLGNGRNESVNLNFTADSGSATITAANLTVLDNNAVANGVQTNQVQVKVTDAYDNVVPNQAVAFIAGNGALLSTPSATTDVDGQAIVTLTNTLAGNSQVTATTNSVSQTVTLTFVASLDAIAITGLVAGFPQVGVPLTVTPSCSGGCSSLGIDYRWQKETAPDSGSYADISGASTSTYLPLKEDQRRQIRVLASD
ncbi:Ig-like domain-containing protein [Pseudomonas fluorescens]|uniref:Ig-like domain-containing protein n=1 Tax=Pseudomonas fluorescens TaxID=294 RepID=UPI00177E71BB